MSAPNNGGPAYPVPHDVAWDNERDDFKARKEAEAITALEGAENDRKSALDGIFGAFKDAFAEPPRGQLGAWED
jgi:hypothetical protein